MMKGIHCHEVKQLLIAEVQQIMQVEVDDTVYISAMLGNFSIKSILLIGDLMIYLHITKQYRDLCSTYRYLKCQSSEICFHQKKVCFSRKQISTLIRGGRTGSAIPRVDLLQRKIDVNASDEISLARTTICQMYTLVFPIFQNRSL